MKGLAFGQELLQIFPSLVYHFNRNPLTDEVEKLFKQIFKLLEAFAWPIIKGLGAMNFGSGYYARVFLSMIEPRQTVQLSSQGGIIGGQRSISIPMVQLPA